MKKKALAILLGVVTVGAAAGTVTELKSYADGVKLQIAGEENGEDVESQNAAEKKFSMVSTADLVDST